jgi:hypothetical protein
MKKSKKRKYGFRMAKSSGIFSAARTPFADAMKEGRSATKNRKPNEQLSVYRPVKAGRYFYALFSASRNNLWQSFNHKVQRRICKYSIRTFDNLLHIKYNDDTSSQQYK